MQAVSGSHLVLSPVSIAAQRASMRALQSWSIDHLKIEIKNKYFDKNSGDQPYVLVIISSSDLH